MDQPSRKRPFDFIGDDFFMHEILSRVDSAESIVRLGMASKRLHSLCSYPSVLEFKEASDNVELIKYLNKFLESMMEKKNIKHEFRRLLLCLQHNTNIPILDFVTVHLLGWFHKALSLNVQELILKFTVHRNSWFQRPELNLLYSNPLKHLRVLTLDNIPIALNDSFEDWISTYCVSLEELNLSGVLVLPTNLAITSSSLRVFTFKGHFTHLHVVSAPKLVTLHVSRSRGRTRIVSHLSLEISDTPNLEDLLLMNWGATNGSLRYGSSGDINFPSLKSATLLFSHGAYYDSRVNRHSLERLLLDIRQTRELCLSDSIVHRISELGLIHTATLFHMLDKFHVRVKGHKDFNLWFEGGTAYKIMSFVKSLPSLKTFKFTTDGRYSRATDLDWLRDALYLNVQELDLQFKKNENLDFYGYNFIPREMKLHYYYSLDHLTVYYYRSNHLRVLTLKDIPMHLNHGFENWISTCCVNLEELNLTGVLVFPSKFIIASSSLKVFTIDTCFADLHVSAPKLATLHVTWNLVYQGKHETNQSLKVSDCPNLEDLSLSNWHKPLPLEYYNSCDDKSNFPSLKSATVLIPEIANNLSLDSLKRLLLDINQTRKLFISDSILHKISCSGIIHSANSIHKLEKLHVLVGEVNNAQTIMSFVKKVRSLKTFKLTIENSYYDPLVSKTFRESLVDNIFNFGFSRAVINLDDNKVKVVVGPGDDETLLLQHIIKNAPQCFKFIFLYQR